MTECYTFENGFDEWSLQELAFPYSGSVVPGGIARFEVRENELNRYDESRAEISNPQDKAAPGSEQWYSLSQFVPATWVDSSRYCVLAQWHATRDDGEVHRSPPLSLWLQDGNFRIYTRYSSVPIMDDNTDGVTVVSQYNQPAQKGVWVDWTFRVIWSHDEGLLQVWKDGVMVQDYRGATMYQDSQGPWFKTGIYRSSRSPGNNVLFLRRFCTGSSYDEVSGCPGSENFRVTINAQVTIERG